MLRRKISFSRWQDKAAFLDAGAWDDVCCPTVRAIARALGEGRAELERARAIHRWVRDAIAYVSDAGEEFVDSQATITRGADDCDGKVRLVLALARACGLGARLVPIVEDGALVHVQAELRAERRWWLSETCLAGVELGEGADRARYDSHDRMITS